MKNIGILVAMEEEAAPVVLELSLEKCGQSPYIYYKGQYEENRIWLLVTGIGVWAASAAVQYMISILKCDTILNLGTCGSSGAFEIGEQICVSRAYPYFFDLTQFGREPFEVPQHGRWQELPTIKGYRKAPCFTTTHFAAEPLDTKGTEAEYVIEMECYGAAYTAKLNKIPFYAVKVVSDNADHHASEDFYNNLPNVMKNAASRAVKQLIGGRNDD